MARLARFSFDEGERAVGHDLESGCADACACRAGDAEKSVLVFCLFQNTPCVETLTAISAPFQTKKISLPSPSQRGQYTPESSETCQDSVLSREWLDVHEILGTAVQVEPSVWGQARIAGVFFEEGDRFVAGAIRALAVVAGQAALSQLWVKKMYWPSADHCLIVRSLVGDLHHR